MTGVLCCLKQRADGICDEHTLNAEHRHLQNTFEANGYPGRMVQRTIRRRGRASETANTKSETEKPRVLILPYLRNTSERIQRTCRVIGVKTVFKSHGTLHQTLTRVKTARLELRKKDVVYEVPCKDCERSYIEETRRNLQIRLSEHKAAVRKGHRKYGIAVHVQDHDHHVDWEAAHVVGQEPHYWRRRVLEALHIAKRAWTVVSP